MFSFLGKGVIKVSPMFVWNAIRNHMNRHVYDRMLKVCDDVMCACIAALLKF